MGSRRKSGTRSTSKNSRVRKSGTKSKSGSPQINNSSKLALGKRKLSTSDNSTPKRKRFSEFESPEKNRRSRSHEKSQLQRTPQYSLSQTHSPMIDKKKKR